LAAGADVLLSARGMDVAAIAKVAFTSEDRVRDVIHNFNADGFASLYPLYRGGRAPKFTLGQRRDVKKARAGHLYAIADREVTPEPAEPEVIFCMDEFGQLNLQPHPGRQWAAVSGKNKEPGRTPRPRRRATYTRTAGVRHLFAACELGEDKLFGHIKPRKNRARFLEFCRYLRTLYPPQIRIAIIRDNFSPHLTTRKDKRVGQWAAANNAEIACTPTNSSWLNRIEAPFTALRYFALDGTDHLTHQEQASMIRRYIIWRNNHAYGERLRRVVTRANVA
jgi:transposase